MKERKNKLIGMYRGIRPCAGCGMLIDSGNFCLPCKRLEKRIIKAGGPAAFARKNTPKFKRRLTRLNPALAVDSNEPPLNILHRPRRKTLG